MLRANGSVLKISVRGGVEIRPTVQGIYKDNSNLPLKLKDLVDRVSEKHPETERVVIEKKMAYIKQTLLEKGEGYGMYRLKTQTAM